MSAHSSASHTVPADRLVWLDLETTGLDPDHDTILEIATVITDKDLNTIATGPVLPVHHPESLYLQMDPWCQQTHGASGLIEACRASTIGLAEAEIRTLRFIERYVPKGASPLAGSSIHFDRAFLRRLMPTLEGHLHFRCLDVSSFREAIKRWRPDVVEKNVKRYPHRAAADIEESIAELRYYREAFAI